MVQLFHLRYVIAGVSNREQPCGAAGTPLSAPAASTLDQGNKTLFLPGNLWESGRPTLGQEMTRVGFGVKSIGKPDAGNRHVRLDERGRETDLSGHRALPRLYPISGHFRLPMPGEPTGGLRGNPTQKANRPNVNYLQSDRNIWQGSAGRRGGTAASGPFPFNTGPSVFHTIATCRLLFWHLSTGLTRLIVL